MKRTQMIACQVGISRLQFDTKLTEILQNQGLS